MLYTDLTKKALKISFDAHLSPPSYCPFQANQKTTPISVELIWEWFSLQVLLFNLISSKIFSIIKNDNLVNAVNNNLIFL